jgi:putative membrane protein
MKKSLITRVAFTAIAALCFIAPARATDETPASSGKKSNLSMNDKMFVKKAYKDGLGEVENGKMAKEKAKNDATKEVAERMITDHSKANEQLEAIAKEENFDISSVKAEPSHMSGADFDKEYLTMLMKHHKKDIAMFEKEANDPGAKEDSDVKQFAKHTLPILKEHLQIVEEALAKTK